MSNCDWCKRVMHKRNGYRVNIKNLTGYTCSISCKVDLSKHFIAVLKESK